MQRIIMRFGRVATNRFSCMCDMSLADGIHFAANGKQIMFGHTFVKCLNVRILDGRSRAATLAIMVASTM